MERWEKQYEYGWSLYNFLSDDWHNLLLYHFTKVVLNNTKIPVSRLFVNNNISNSWHTFDSYLFIQPLFFHFGNNDNLTLTNTEPKYFILLPTASIVYPSIISYFLDWNLHNLFNNLTIFIDFIYDVLILIFY